MNLIDHLKELRKITSIVKRDKILIMFQNEFLLIFVVVIGSNATRNRSFNIEFIYNVDMFISHFYKILLWARVFGVCSWYLWNKVWLYNNFGANGLWWRLVAMDLYRTTKTKMGDKNIEGRHYFILNMVI